MITKCNIYLPQSLFFQNVNYAKKSFERKVLKVDNGDNSQTP